MCIITSVLTTTIHYVEIEVYDQSMTCCCPSGRFSGKAHSLQRRVRDPRHLADPRCQLAVPAHPDPLPLAKNPARHPGQTPAPGNCPCPRQTALHIGEHLSKCAEQKSAMLPLLHVNICYNSLPTPHADKHCLDSTPCKRPCLPPPHPLSRSQPWLHVDPFRQNRQGTPQCGSGGTRVIQRCHEQLSQPNLPPRKQNRKEWEQSPCSDLLIVFCYQKPYSCWQALLSCPDEGCKRQVLTDNTTFVHLLCCTLCISMTSDAVVQQV